MLRNKIAWVTGAGTGIGLAGAKALAEAGAVVVLSGRRAEVLEAAAAELRARSANVEVEPLDVSDAQAVERVADVIAARHGRVDVLVNSAGLNTTKRSWSEQTPAGWDQVVRANLDGSFYCVHAVLPLMRAQREGVIINVSSWAGVRISAVTGPAYNASKHAVVSMTETLNMEECKNGIRASVVCPAEVATPILDRRPVPPSPEERARMLQPEDLGETIRWVADQPAHVCVNEIIISPTWNRLFVGGADRG